MKFSEDSIKIEEGTLHFLIAGKGKEVLFCFHGYGQNKEVFVPAIPLLEKKFTLFIVDLFYHGKSELGIGRVLDLNFLEKLFDIITKKYQIEKFSLLGFSIGAKICWGLLMKYPSRIDKLYLLAPDGIKNNFWYSMSTATRLGRWVFYQFISRPDFLKYFVSLLSNFKLLPKRTKKFTLSQVTDQQHGQKVYHTWVSFRELKFAHNKIVDQLNANNISVLIFYGIYDKIIKEEDLIFFAKKINSCKLYPLPSGHSNLVNATISFITKNSLDLN